MKTILLALLLLCAPLSAAPAVSLLWDANPAAEAVTGYKVYRKGGTAAAPTWALVGTVAGNVLKFPLAGQAPGAFAITATNLAGESGRSNEVTLPAGPTVPLGLKIQVEIVIPPQ